MSSHAILCHVSVSHVMSRHVIWCNVRPLLCEQKRTTYNGTRLSQFLIESNSTMCIPPAKKIQNKTKPKIKPKNKTISYSSYSGYSGAPNQPKR